MAKTMKTTTVNTKEDNKMSFHINPLNGRKFTTSEIGRGIGIHKTDKGKGSYTRKAKHKDRDSNC